MPEGITHELGASMPYEQWNDELSRVYGTWVPSASASVCFRAQLASRTIGNFKLVECICDPCSASRGGRQIAADDLEMLAIQLIISGGEVFTIDSRSYRLGPGDLLIWNTTRPMKFEVTQRLQKISIIMPLARLRSWLPGTWHSIRNMHAHGSTASALIYPLVKSIVPELFSGSIRNGEALTEGMLGTLVSSLGADGKVSICQKSQRLGLVKKFIEEHLDDAMLTPSEIAVSNNMSLRYLYSLFEEEGQTVQKFIIHQRLLRCQRELSNPSMDQRAISEVAYSWGFHNAAHFSRRFKDAFGVSPRDYRKAIIVKNGSIH
ncbi:helix-turn-helix domain-containing protein [Halomonas salipaludis]|nr:helix-turn-helix domain-containing protein [Halomonas salipaludis]